MTPPFLDTAIVKAMQRDPSASQLAIRNEVGCTTADFKEAVQRLRYAGKIEWGGFALSPSLQNSEAASRAARKVRASNKHSPAAGPVKEGSGISLGGKPACHPSPDAAQPGPSTISEQVRAEAVGKAQRRVLARKISTGLTPLPQEESIADRFRRLAREQEEDEAAELAEVDAQERRDRDLDRLASPSAVLRRAQRDWPGQCQRVAMIAAELGIGLGECWRRVIAAGVDCLTEAGEEGAAV